MKPASLLLLLLLLALIPANSGTAQEPAAAMYRLDVGIWPDYDRRSVLVLLTGTLPAGSRLPASVVVPLPEDARINAVARIDARDGRMKDDIASSTDMSGTLTFVTPDPGFRVEYYFPYVADGMQRFFDFAWTAPVSVENFQLRVQRPAAADAFRTEPAAAEVQKGGDGLEYHLFPARPLPAGQSFSLRAAYTMAADELSVAGMPPPGAGAQPAAQPAGQGTGSGFDWALAAVIAGGILFIGALIWQFAARRGSRDVGQPAGEGGEKGAGVNFCGNCGAPAGKGDRFCRGCGSRL